ncbi:MAG: glycine cleavage system protein H [Bacteroidales bacterium]
MVVLILIAFLLMFFIIDAIVLIRRKAKSKMPVLVANSSRSFNEASISAPKGLYFDKTHTWAFMEKNGIVKIGIDDFLLHITGTLSRVKMKSPGDKIYKGEAVLSIIRNGKQLSINSPITGTIKLQNNQLLEDCSILNTAPYSEGWVYMVEPSNWLREIQFLIMSEKYKEWLKNEFSRLKDFLVTIQTKNNTTLIPIILQDGGELKDNLLEDLEPEVWEEFQAKFINTSK